MSTVSVHGENGYRNSTGVQQYYRGIGNVQGYRCTGEQE
jgi:hypothetical protein